MRVTLTPNQGAHEIEIDHVKLTSIQNVDEYIRYLKTLRDMLWKNKNARPAPKDD